jgi:membrane fusion protein, multidrug efflux system
MKQRKRKIVVVTVFTVIATLGGAYAYHSFHSEPEEKPHLYEPIGKHKLNPNGSELIVRSYKIGSSNGSGSNGSVHSFTGSLQPRYMASVGFRVAGKISERKVELGQQITKGQVLFRLDPEDADLQLRVAESDFTSAQSLVKQASAEERRLAQLRSSGSVSQSDYDLAIATRDVATARVDSAERRLTLAQNQRTYFDLAADTDGLVTSIMAEAGQVVNVGQPVLQIMQRNELEAVVSLPEGLVADVKNLQAIAHFWSRPDVALRAELREMSPMADTVSRTFDARFRLIDSAPDLAIGMTASIQLRDPGSQGISVPLTSIASRASKPIVWRIVLSDDRSLTSTVEAIPVEVIQYKSDTAVVRADLQNGDRIVSAGVQRIDEDVQVRLWESK